MARRLFNESWKTLFVYGLVRSLTAAAATVADGDMEPRGERSDAQPSSESHKKHQSPVTAALTASVTA